MIVKSCGNGVLGEAVPSQAGWFRCLSQHCRCSCHRPTVSQAFALKTCCMSWRKLAVSISQSPRESACCDLRVNSSGGRGRGLSTGCVIRNQLRSGPQIRCFTCSTCASIMSPMRLCCRLTCPSCWGAWPERQSVKSAESSGSCMQA